MEFEWDESKSLTNLEKHGLDFQTASEVFDDPDWVLADTRAGDTGEVRFRATGLTEDGVLHSVIFTMRGARTRIISARRARTDERREYHRIPEAS